MSFRNSASTLDASEIEGTLTGNTIQTAASGRRIALNDPAYPNELIIASGSASEVTPGRLSGGAMSANVGTSQLRSPALVANKYGVLTLEGYDDGHSNADLQADTIGVEANGQLDLIDFSGGPVRIGSDIIPGSHVSVTGDAIAAGAIDGTALTENGVPVVIATDSVPYSVAYSGTTDASGFLTVSHAAGFTPSGGWAMTTNPNSSFAQPYGIDTLTGTTVRLRFANVAGTGAAASTAVSGRLFLVR